MSYIRSISNPEGLYIVGTGENVEIYVKTDVVKYIPGDIFDGLIKKYIDNFYEDCEYKGASIQYVKRGKDFKIEFSYSDWKIYMWDVTWNYIVMSEEIKEIYYEQNHNFFYKIFKKVVNGASYASRAIHRKSRDTKAPG